MNIYRRLSAGHTAIHVACRLGNVPILHMLLSIKKTDSTDDEQQQQQREEKHIYECLRLKDQSNLTPIHWAATQESVSKRQKIFAYLDRRMPGILDSRYNLNWFDSWAQLRPWVIEQTNSK
jgi:ankyrin repeat protein